MFQDEKQSFKESRESVTPHSRLSPGDFPQKNSYNLNFRAWQYTALLWRVSPRGAVPYEHTTAPGPVQHLDEEKQCWTHLKITSSGPGGQLPLIIALGLILVLSKLLAVPLGLPGLLSSPSASGRKPSISLQARNKKLF